MERSLRDAGELLARMPRLLQYLPDQSSYDYRNAKATLAARGSQSPHILTRPIRNVGFGHSDRLSRTDCVPDDWLECRLFRSEPEGQAHDWSALVNRQHVLLG